MSAKSDPIQGRRSTKSKTPNVVYASEIQEDEAVFGLFPRLAKGLKLAIILIVQIVCAFMISQYSISHTRKGEERMQRLLNASLSIYWNVGGHPSTSSPKLINVVKIVTFPYPRTIHSEINRKSLGGVHSQLYYRSLSLRISQRDHAIWLSCVVLL